MLAGDPYNTTGLSAGDKHYRAFVGPPERYDLMAISQVALLNEFGLREWHHLLDFGCGSLRLGRMMLPFLLPERYFGIEPEAWLIEDAFAHELGQDIRRLKSPAFSQDRSFDCGIFNQQFDFIIAQSIVTHCGFAETKSLLATAATSLREDGVFLFSFIDDPQVAISPPEEGWVYPNCVCLSQEFLSAQFAELGLAWKVLSWPHPGARWGAAARSQGRLITGRP